MPNVPIARVVLAFACTGGVFSAALHGEESEVAVIHAAPWSPGDAVREGAGGFEVMLSVARVLQTHPHAAIVGVGDRHGLFTDGAQRALRFVAFRGVPVVVLASGGEPVADPEGIFLDGGDLTVAQASAVLQHCLEHAGALPAAADPAHPTDAEMAALRESLRPYRDALALKVFRQTAADTRPGPGPDIAGTRG